MIAIMFWVLLVVLLFVVVLHLWAMHIAMRDDDPLSDEYWNVRR